jgi:DNA primase
MDPDDFVRERGAEAYLNALKGSKSAIEFLADEMAERYNLEHPRDRAKACNEVLPFVARLESPVERTSYLNLIADRLRVDEDVLRDELRAALKAGKKQIHGPRRDTRGVAKPQPARPPQPAAPMNRAEGRLVVLLAQSPQARDTMRRELEDGDLAGSSAETIVKTLLEEPADRLLEPANLAGLLPDEASRALLARVLLERDEEEEQTEGQAEEARSCLAAIRRSRLTRERAAVQKQLETNRDAVNLEELMARKMELSRRIDALS